MPRPKKQDDPTTTAAVALEQADKAITTARARLAEIRHQARTSLIESRDLEERVQAELVAAGREGREPAHVAEWRSRLAELDQHRRDLEAQERGANLAVSTAEGERKHAQLLHYPELAQQLDQAETELIERRERLDAEQASLAAAESAHRSAWTALVSVVPGFERGSSFIPLEAQGTHYSPGAGPAPLLHPARRPEHADGALIGLMPSETWPQWLVEAWERTPRPDQQATPVAMSIDAATFAGDDTDTYEIPTPTPADEAAQKRAMARAADAAANNNSILI